MTLYQFTTPWGYSYIDPGHIVAVSGELSWPIGSARGPIAEATKRVREVHLQGGQTMTVLDTTDNLALILGRDA